MEITPQQVAFFNTFGCLKLTQAFRDDIDWITSEFAQVFVDRGVVHDGTKRSMIVPFIDQREKLATLLDHPVIQAAATALLGEGFNYLSGDGNYYSGDTAWHPDGTHPVGPYIKMAFYLDPVRGSNGALRVIPGTHRTVWDWMKHYPFQTQALWGVQPNEVPALALDSDPGDLLIFNHNTLHASFGGSGFRRMFTLNLGARAKTPEELTELENYVRQHCKPWGDRVHGETMRRTASPARMRHLQQPIDCEWVLDPEGEKRRNAAPEPVAA